MSIAVIIPVYNSAAMLAEALHALQRGTRQPDELWVVDDASADDSAAVAAALGAKVLRMDRNAGPAACRNRAALLTSSSILVFFVADTWVHPETLARIEQHFLDDPSLNAVIGAYDDAPPDPGMVSRHRNLAHCFVHRSGRARALTFWSGCGAVTRPAFLRAEGFDERYRRPSVEDIELGYRMTGQGHRILLDPSIVVKHAKRWTLRSAVVTDVRDRGIPWMVLLLDRGSMPDDLNISLRNRASTAMTGLALLCFALAFHARILLFVALALVIAALALHAAMFRFIARRHPSLLPVSCAMFLLGELCNLVAVAGGTMSSLTGGRRGTRTSAITQASLSLTAQEHRSA